jgi:hypothetical protein
MTIILISLVWFAALVALVARLASRPELIPARWERSPCMLQDKHTSLEEAISQLLHTTPEAKNSKPATAEHVRDRTQQDLYVRP